mmetsp:Transcript_8103/g.19274  ORF Transcript_8103/g.19274 Transcript_8103/m.19274 type:complete len:499 (-) Transcript_8103:102-1598(-)
MVPSPRLFALVASLSLAQITVLSPQSLVKHFAPDGKVQGSTATFGAPLYGEVVQGRLIYVPSASHHCKDDYTLWADEFYDESEVEEKTLVASVVIVDRGSCTFVTKVKLAQEHGAHAVIVVDNDSTKSTAEIQQVIMGDDGWGNEVTIPSILVSYQDGRQLQEAAQDQRDNNRDAMIKLEWDVPQSHDAVVDFWTSSGSREAAAFLTAFRPFAESLGGVPLDQRGGNVFFSKGKQNKEKRRMDFIPHYYISKIPQSTANCYKNEEKYCVEDPDGTGPITGRDVIDEDLRQMCLWKLTSDMEDQEDVGRERFSGTWFEYIRLFHERCHLSTGHGKMFGEDCSYEVMQSLPEAKEELSNIKKCVRTDAETLLHMQTKNTAWGVLALRINGWRFRGALEPETVTRAICASFPWEPPECKDMIEHFGGRKVDKIMNQKPLLSLEEILLIGLGCAVVVTAILCVYRCTYEGSLRNLVREEVMLEMKNAVFGQEKGKEQYLSLD